MSAIIILLPVAELNYKRLTFQVLLVGGGRRWTSLIAIVVFLSSIWSRHWKHIRDPDSAIYPVELGLPLISSNSDELKGSRALVAWGILRSL